MIEVPTVVRPVTGVPDIFPELSKRFRIRANQEGFSTKEKRSLQVSRYFGEVALLQSAELLYFTRTHGITLDQQATDKLADHLENALPESLDTPITVAATPTSILAAGDRRRFLVLGATSVFAEERQIVHGIVAAHYNVTPSDSSWLDLPRGNGCEYLMTNHVYSDDVIELAQEVVEGMPALQQSSITYGPVEIHMPLHEDPSSVNK